MGGWGMNERFTGVIANLQWIDTSFKNRENELLEEHAQTRDELKKLERDYKRLREALRLIIETGERSSVEIARGALE
jgi:hypothetical protein